MTTLSTWRLGIALFFQCLYKLCCMIELSFSLYLLSYLLWSFSLLVLSSAALLLLLGLYYSVLLWWCRGADVVVVVCVFFLL